MLTFQLFRVKVFAPAKPSLFADEFVPQLVLVETIRTRPAAELRTGFTWHIGNLVQLDTFGMYFALGRTTRSTIELYDNATGEFVEREFETSPYTHVICDTSLEVCGIAPKSQLAPTTKGSAGYVALERVSGTLHGRSGTFVLQHSGTMDRGAAQLTITVVPDSGTGELVGLAGKMAIQIAEGRHSYDFEYTLAEAPRL